MGEHGEAGRAWVVAGWEEALMPSLPQIEVAMAAGSSGSGVEREVGFQWHFRHHFPLCQAALLLTVRPIFFFNQGDWSAIPTMPATVAVHSVY